MMQRFKVERRGGDLNTEEWTFWYYDNYHPLYLDDYGELERATTRHKFRYGAKHYTRTGDTRSNTLKVEEVPLPPDVIAEAKSKFMAYMDSVKIEKWLRR